MPKPGVGIMNLATGEAIVAAERVKSFRLPDPLFSHLLWSAVLMMGLGVWSLLRAWSLNEAPAKA